MLLVALAIFYILGCFLDGISIVVLTMAVLMPTIQTAGIDPLWFGIFVVVVVVEMAQVTRAGGLQPVRAAGPARRARHDGDRALRAALLPADGGRGGAAVPVPRAGHMAPWANDRLTACARGADASRRRRGPHFRIQSCTVATRGSASAPAITARQ